MADTNAPKPIAAESPDYGPSPAADFSGPRSRWTTLPLIGWMAFVAWGSLSPSNDLPGLGLIGFPSADKFVHVGMYAVLGLLMLRAWKRGIPATWREACGAALAAAAFGGYIELLQSLTPDRHCDGRDMIANTLGALLGVTLVIRLQRRRPQSLIPTCLLLLAPALSGLGGCGHIAAPPPPPFDHDYPQWNTLLARFVSEKGVDYAALKGEPLILIDALAPFRAVEARVFSRWSREQRIAFLVNAHNAFAIDRIIAHYPVASIEETHWLRSARDATDIRILGRDWSLNGIALTLMGPEYHEARLIFLLNWASAGCAPIPPVAATPANLTSLLDRQTRIVFSDERYCQYDDIHHTIYVTPLLDWYREQFNREYTTLWIFLEHFLSPADAAAIKRHAPRIRVLPFDNSLNDANLQPLVRVEHSADPTANAAADQ
jgi:hypothetical protein